MTIWDLQKITGQEIDDAISKMSKSEIKEVLDSIGWAEGRAYFRKVWEKLSGSKYSDL